MLLHTTRTAAASVLLAVVNGLAGAGDRWAIGLGCDKEAR